MRSKGPAHREYLDVLALATRHELVLERLERPQNGCLYHVWSTRTFCDEWCKGFEEAAAVVRTLAAQQQRR
jgi:hypothetical protein